MAGQFLPFVVDSFESDPELYLAVLKRTPHRASETVRYLRGTVRLDKIDVNQRIDKIPLHY